LERQIDYFDFIIYSYAGGYFLGIVTSSKYQSPGMMEFMMNGGDMVGVDCAMSLSFDFPASMHKWR